MGLPALLFFPFHVGHHFPEKNFGPVSVLCPKMAGGRLMDLFCRHRREQVLDLASEDAFARLSHKDAGEDKAQPDKAHYPAPMEQPEAQADRSKQKSRLEQKYPQSIKGAAAV